MSAATARGNAGDPEKDPALFPESRVRPWAVDEKAERQMEDMVDDFEKTLMLISPVKEGLGQSVLDRSCRDDDRGDLFYAELAALQAKKEAKAARGGSGCSSSLSIGEIFESLYRETHGHPPRKKRPASVRGSSTVDTELSADDNQDDEEAGVVAEGGETDDEEETAAEEEEDGRLADDSDVARLLAELQADFDSDGSDLEAEEPGADGVAPEVVTENENEQVPALAESGIISCGESGNHAECGEAPQGVGSLAATAISSSPSCQRDGANQDSGEELSVPRSSATQPEEDYRSTVVVDGSQRSEEDNLSGEKQSRVGISRMKIDAPDNLSGEKQSRVGISRMKIDAPERGARAGPRPQSAPSTCLSSGKFSRLSRASSSHLARTVSQKVLQATKEAEERASSEARQGGDMRHPRAPGSASARADGRPHSSRNRGDASQASTPVRRTSYLRSRQSPQPRAPRWAPRDAGVWLAKPLSQREAGVPPGTVQSSVRQRPHTATNRRRPSAKELEPPPRFNPLLSGPEVEFLFGKADHGTSSTAQQQPPPSLRKTTLGRLLRRTASSNADGNPLLRQASEHGSPGSPRSCCRPLSAETRLLFDGDGTRDSRGDFKSARNATSVAQTKMMMPRPSSATASTGGRGRRPSSAKERSSLAGSEASGTPGGRKRQAGCRVSSRTPSHKEIAEPKKHRDTLLAADSSTRNHLTAARGTTTARMPLEGGVKASERGGNKPRPTVSVNQALNATLAEAIGTVSPLEQFVNARKTVAEMKQINTKDSTGDILVSTQGMPKARIKEECWSSESHRQYR